MQQITKAAVSALRIEVQAALAALAEKHGLKITCGNASYTDADVTFKLELAVPAAAADKNKRDFEAYAPMLGMKPEWFGATVSMGGKTFTIVGIAPNRRTKPVRLLSDGKEYTTTVESITLRLRDKVSL